MERGEGGGARGGGARGGEAGGEGESSGGTAGKAAREAAGAGGGDGEELESRDSATAVDEGQHAELNTCEGRDRRNKVAL